MTEKSLLLLESLSDGVIMLNPDGMIIYCNPSVTKICGFTLTDLFNKSFDFFYESGLDPVRAAYELKTAEKTGRFDSEGWKKKKDGKFWGCLTISAFGSGTELAGYSCILRDTTQQKNEELRLRASEERYRLMAEGVKDYSIFLLDTNGIITTWNIGAQIMTEYRKSEILGQHFSIFYPPEEITKKKPELELTVATATGRYEEEAWRVKKNGVHFWANVVVTALYNDRNQLIGFSKVTRDLSERKKNEELLRLSEERYRLLVDQVSDYGIFMMDEEGRIVSWNVGAKRIKGYNADEVIGKYFSLFYPEEEIIKAKPAMELRVARSEGKYEEEGWRLRKDGSRFWANVVITAVYNSSQNLIGFSKVTRDLTERKQNELAINETNRRLRLLTEEQKITNAELYYANQELEQFTSIVSHDLQEPVRTIKSFLQLIDMNIPETETLLKTYIGKSISATNRMRELILHLLNYSQLSKGEWVMQTVDVKELVATVQQNLITAIDSSKTKITTNLQVTQVEGDRVQLIQLIQNLMGNALKFSDEKLRKIHISSVMENGYVKFGVKDNGIGIAEGDLHKVFEIFRRLNPDNLFPGTGIGLAICKKIVDRHGGKIWPESTLGEGTTFYFTLKNKSTAALHEEV
ncbi:MAG: PAS domain S-box protein [Chitinophagaceae bacterium]|nr:PAS domain S-box protein [Chitinophagaceae bacterium]